MLLPLVPMPATLTSQPGAFALGASISIQGDGKAGALLSELLDTRTGLNTAGSEPATITLEIEAAANATAEAYRLSVDESSVRIIGSDAAGLFYGIHTLVQLLQQSPIGWQLPLVQIADAPRFAYRGVMLDVARHFFEVDTVKAYIDRASALKFNHLHLHLTDDQGWRIDIPSRPLLTERGANTAVSGDAGGFYSIEDYREIVAYAASRHMVVVPEIDLPGHTHAVGLAYPELAAEPAISDTVLEDVRLHGGEIPRAGVAYDGMAVGFSSLRTQEPATREFVSDVLRAVAEATPGPYLHVGGDESLGTDPAEYQDFMLWVTTAVAELNKTPVVWHEAGGALAPGTVGQYWGLRVPTQESAAKTETFVGNGGKVILSPADAVYFDIKPRADHPLGLIWTGGPTSLSQSYDWEPALLIDSIDEQDILGIEAPLWTETVRTLNDIDSLVFPRIAAVAELAWSKSRDTDTFGRRAEGLLPLWDAFGIHPDA